MYLVCTLSARGMSYTHTTALHARNARSAYIERGAHTYVKQIYDFMMIVRLGSAYDAPLSTQEHFSGLHH